MQDLNAEFDSFYLEDPRNPRWIAKPTVAYLWARTAECGDCRAEIPLLKTRWLCRRGDKRVLLAMAPREDRSGVEFDLERDVPTRGDDDEFGAGTMSQSGAECPCCGGIATMQDLRAQGCAGRLGARMTAVVVDGQEGKEYRLPREEEFEAAEVSQEELEALYANVPSGLPNEAISPARPSPNSRGASRIAALRIRHMGQAVQQPATPGSGRSSSGDSPRSRGDGFQPLPRRVAGSDRRQSGAVDQPACGSLQRSRNLDKRPREPPQRLRTICVTDGLGLRGIVSSDGHHGRIRPSYRMDRPGL